MPAPAPRTPLPRIASALAWALLAALAVRTVWPTDIGWQTAAGRWILRHGPPATDVLSWSAPGRAWVEMRWLWCAAIAALRDGPGAWAISLFAALLSVGAFAVAWRAGARRPGADDAAILGLAALTASQRLVARPELVTVLCAAVFLVVLERQRHTPGRMALALLPVQVLWINAHTMGFLGPVLAALAFAVAAWDGRRGRPPGVARAGALLAGVTLACAVSPYARQLPAFAATLVRESSDPALRSWIPELQPTFAGGGGPVARIAAPLLALAAWVSLLAARRRPSAFLAAAWLLTAGLALGSVRHLALFALASVALVRGAAGAPRSAVTERGAARMLSVAAALLALGGLWLVVTQRFQTLQHDTSRFGLGDTPHRYPAEAMRAVAAMRRRDGSALHVFGTPMTASWGLAEGVASHTDLRTEVQGMARLARAAAAWATGPALDRLAREDDVDAVAVELDDAALAARLARDRVTWRTVYLDECARVFVRNAAPVGTPALAPERLDSLARAVRARLPEVGVGPWSRPFGSVPAAAPYQRFGMALLEDGRPDLAEPFLADAVQADPASPSAWVALGNARERMGHRPEALAARQRAARLAPRDPDVASALALQLIEEARAGEARDVLGRALAAAPAHALCLALSGEAAAALGDTAQAVLQLERAVRADAGLTHAAARLAALRARLTPRPASSPGQ